ncbi:MAG: hypothetical protein Q9210_007468 [Variospora velana]
MITEITILQLQAGVDDDLQSPESSEGKAVRDALSRKVRKEGARFAYYGQSIEQPRTAFTVVGLGAPNTYKHGSGSLENAQWFIRPNEVDSPADSSSPNLLNTEKPATVIRVPFYPHPDPSPALGNQAVTEVVFFHFPADLTIKDKDDVMKSIDKMRPVVARSEALSVFDGWAMEHTTNEAGEKIQFYVNLVGWVDVDAHMRFQSSDDFKQNVHHVMDIQEVRLFETHHVKLYAVNA